MPGVGEEKGGGLAHHPSAPMDEQNRGALLIPRMVLRIEDIWFEVFPPHSFVYPFLRFLIARIRVTGRKMTRRRQVFKMKRVSMADRS
ncbi:MAG: hypothetical protein ACOCTQ_03140 [Planctomycetota bacterium]